jgi:hypothetical protein
MDSINLARLLEELKEKHPEYYRHIVALIKAISRLLADNPPGRGAEGKSDEREMK